MDPWRDRENPIICEVSSLKQGNYQEEVEFTREVSHIVVGKIMRFVSKHNLCTECDSYSASSMVSLVAVEWHQHNPSNSSMIIPEEDGTSRLQPVQGRSHHAHHLYFHEQSVNSVDRRGPLPLIGPLSRYFCMSSSLMQVRVTSYKMANSQRRPRSCSLRSIWANLSREVEVFGCIVGMHGLRRRCVLIRTLVHFLHGINVDVWLHKISPISMTRQPLFTWTLRMPSIHNFTLNR